MSWMQTYLGTRVDLPRPRPEQINVVDIAWSLAHQCRFNGHTRAHYSVAQHSVLVARRLGQQGERVIVRLAGLLHDAAEAYTGDLTRPMKELLPDFAQVEFEVQSAIERVLLPPDRATLGERDRETIHAADNLVLGAEICFVLPRGAAARECVLPVWPISIHPWPAERAYESFLHTYEDLSSELCQSEDVAGREFGEC